MRQSKPSRSRAISFASSDAPARGRRGALGARLRGAVKATLATVVIAASGLFAIAFVAVGPAGANAADPNPVTTGTFTLNADGTVTATLGGTWTWVGQDCAGRYGTGWAVDWWGISTSTTPSPNFNLTNASEVVYPPGTSTTTGTVSPFGVSIGNLSGGRVFHVGQYYSGQTINSPTTCSDIVIGGKASSTAPWSATATYPSFADVPAQMCVNMYDEHGSEGTQSGSAKDFSPSLNDDNSIKTNDFDPSGGTFCLNSTTTTTQLSGSSSITLGSGGSVTDAVTVTGNATAGLPAGTVNFYVCGPTVGNALCTSTSNAQGTATLPAAADTGFVSTGTSSTFTPTAVGTYCFAAVFFPTANSNYGESADNVVGTVDPKECVTVTKATTGSVTTAHGSGALGTSGNISDGVVVTGNTAGGSPTGNVTFYTCGPSVANPSACGASSAHLLSTQVVALTVGTSPDSSASTTPFAPTKPGTWCFGASYAGDNNYTGSTDNTTGNGDANECVTVTPGTSGSVTTAVGSGVLGASGNISDGVVVSGNATGGSPTGNVTFYTCGPSVASPSACGASSPNLLATQVVSLTAGTSPDSHASTTAFTPHTTGTWCFGASYAGDTNYAGSTDNTTGNGDANECVTVTKAGSGSVTTAHGSGVLGASGNISDGVVVSGNLTGGSPTGNVTFYTCGPAVANPSACGASSPNLLATQVVGLTAGTSPDSSAATTPFTPHTTGTWCFGASYAGDTNYSGSTDNTTGNGDANECVTVTKAGSGSVTTAHGSGVLGASGNISDGVVVSGNLTGGSPTGNVTFYTCGPSVANPSACGASSPNLLATQVVGLTAGTSPDSSASSGFFTPTTTGTWCFGASYAGDSNYSGSTDNTTGNGDPNECVTVTKAGSGSVTTAHGSGVLGASGNISDGVVVSGNLTGGSPTGNVTFYTCGPSVANPSACGASSPNLLATQVVGLTAGTSPDSSASTTAFTPHTTGTWCFGASYAGDSNYTGSTDNTTGNGDPNECVTVTKAGSGSVTTAHGSGVLGASGNISDGVVVTGNLTGGSPTGNVTFYTCGPSVANPSACGASSPNLLATQVVGLAAGTSPDSSAATTPFTPHTTGTWCFGASYAGDTNYSGSTDNTTGNGDANECVTVTNAGSGSVTTAHGSGVLGASGNISDGVVVTGNLTGGSPTGNVTFYTCGPSVANPSACGASSPNLLATQVVALTAGTSPDSSAATTAFTPHTTGTWCFGASYAGDSNYSGSTDNTTGNGDANECVTVTKAGSGSVTTAHGSGVPRHQRQHL